MAARSGRRFALAGLIGYLATAVLIVARLSQFSHGRTFFYDEWSFVVNRNSWSWEALMAAHNGHPSLFPAAIHIVLFNSFGLAQFTWYLASGFAMHLAVCALAAAFVHRRLGLLPGVFGFLAFGLLGTGWQNSLWPFQVGFMGSVAGFLATVLLLDRISETPGRAPNRLLTGASALCLLYSVMSSGVGVAALAGTIIWIAVRRNTFRTQWWVPLPAMVVYAAWYVRYGGQGGQGFTPAAVPRYVAESASHAVGGLFDLDVFWGALLTGTLIVLIAIKLLRPEQGRSTVWVAAAGFLIAFWGLTAVSRGALGEPGASRYVYVGVIVGVAGATSALSPTLRTKWLFSGLALLSVMTTSSTLTAGASGLQYEGEIMRTLLAWVDVHGERMPQDMVVDERHSPGLTVGGYRSALARLDGSPARGMDLTEVGGQFAERLDLLVSRSWVFQTPPFDGECASGVTASRIELESGSSLSLTTAVDTTIEIRRFAPEVAAAAPVPLPAGSYSLSSPVDPWPQPYVVVVATPEHAQVCE